MSFNIFGPATKNDIRVGYISTERGFVDGFSVCQANDYARRNPGTQFVFRTRDEIKYLTINEVNVLTPDDLLPKSSKDCPGIDLESNCGPSKVYFYGGGGVGVKANPIIGQDGSLLAVDLVAGGFGYQYPPITEVKDSCGIGVGVVVRSVLGEIIETVEYYDQEDDFEDYEICLPTDAGFGRVYSPDGKDVGEWDPTLYANFSKDPIRREIQQYQRFLTSLQGGARINLNDNTIKRWWTTRTEIPLSVTSLTRTTRVKHDVRHPGWGGEYAQGSRLKEETFKIFTSGGGANKGGNNLAFNFTTEDKSHSFKIKASDFKNNQTGQEVRIKVKPNTVYLVSSEGQYKGKGSEIGIVEGLGKKPKEVNTKTKEELFGKSIFADFLNTANDNDDLQAEAGIGKFSATRIGAQKGRSTYNVKYEFKDNSAYKPEVIEDSFMNTHAVSPVPPSNVPGTDFAGITFTMEWEKDFPYPGEYTFKGMGDNIAKIYLDNEILFTATEFRKDHPPHKLKKTVKEGVHRIRVDLYNIPIKEKVIVQKSDSSTESQQISRVFNTVDYIGKANRKLWRCNVYGRGGFINEYGISPFDTTVQLQDNPYAGTHRIVWDNVDFPVDGNYIIELEVDDNVTLTLQGGGTEVVINKRGFSSPTQSTGKSTETRAFKKGKYKIIADLEQIPGGRFGFTDIKGINPMALAINIQTAFTEEEVISKKSWAENPMGVALVIDAPLPPVPQEPVLDQEGRCPRNPIWSTRFPGANEKWYPVRFDPTRWSKFMNRYAISPIIPIAEKGSDGGGIVYRNSWNLDIPYDGFYALRGTVDNGGRILIDGKEIARGGGLSFKGRSSGKLDGFGTENPQTTKVFLTRGIHSIEVEVENEKTEIFELVNQKVFNTSDWISKQPESQKVDVKFNISSSADNSNSISISDLGINESKTYKGKQINKKITKSVEVGKVYTVTLRSPESKNGVKLRSKGSTLEVEEASDNDWTDIICSVSQGRFFDFKNGKNQATCKYTIDAVKGSGPLVKGGVTYSGPVLANYRNGSLGPFLTPAFTSDEDYRANNMDKTWIMTWDNVDFPVDGQYTLRAEADDYVIVRVDGVEVGVARVFEGVRTFNFNVTRGKRKVEMELYNIPGNDRSTFDTNPVVFSAIITVPVNQSTGLSRPWTVNPIGISAILIPPPCPKRIRGKGVITEVIVDDPGNGNPSFPNNVPPSTASTYPVTLRLKSVIVENPGINHNCGVDEIQITPSNGAVLSYNCDSFGRIKSVDVLDPGLGFTSYPDITMITDTGINASFRPQFEVVRDPIVADPAKLIQVTDLVGLKQTGYVDGRAYFGAVFYKDGVRYAGFYETPGELVQVYDTLQESIDAQVVTRPSAILRQGTDTNSNNPRLNLPGTPDTLI